MELRGTLRQEILCVEPLLWSKSPCLNPYDFAR
jgi:hypothetical protein